MIKKIQIPYNKYYIELKIPEKNIANLVGVDEELIRGTNSENLENAISNYDSEKLQDQIQSKNVALIVEDHTREVPFEDRFNALFPILKTAKQVNVILATGTHDGENAGNYNIRLLAEKAANQFNVKLKKTVIHSCHTDDYYLAGTTESLGNDIYVNTEIRDADIIIIFSDMKNHYFGGYSNPLKGLIPGICKYETIERNHALTLNDKSMFGHHPLHPEKSRRDNPLAQDMYEGVKLIAGDRPIFVLGTICKKDKILWTKFGRLEEIVPEGFQEVDKRYSVQVEPTDRIIVSSAGYPNDESLYICQRALELTKNAINTDGEILFLAGCANGIGPKKSITNFYEPLKADIDYILNSLSEKYIMYSHKTYKFAQLIKRMKAIYFYSELSNSEIESIHLTPTNSPQEIVDQWIAENENVKINIFTEGNKVAVYSK